MPEDPISWAEALARVDEALAEVSALRNHVKDLQDRHARTMQSLQDLELTWGSRNDVSRHHVADSPSSDDHEIKP